MYTPSMLPCEQMISQDANQTLQNAPGLAWNTNHTSPSGEYYSLFLGFLFKTHFSELDIV